MKLKGIKNRAKKYKIVFLTFALFLLLGIICLVLDYFNIPYRLGINFNFLNLNFWSIFLGNGIVMALFITTFILFDKRNLDKEKLADYAGIVLLIDAYYQCESFLQLFEELLKNDNAIERPLPKKQIEYVCNEPFKNDDKIFECLVNGHILREHYDAYSKIKSDYGTLAFLSLEYENLLSIRKLYFKRLTNEIKEEKIKLEKYKENLN